MLSEIYRNVLFRAFSPLPSSGKEKYLERRHERKGPKGYTGLDKRIAENVCETLYWHPEVDATDIEVNVREGVVYLTGSVDSRHAKKMAEYVLDGIRGVTDVQNRLTIKPMLDLDSDKIIARGDDGLFTEENIPR